jgi:peptidoglycan/LPS O-acetylase OafA/YrhL
MPDEMPDASTQPTEHVSKMQSQLPVHALIVTACAVAGAAASRAGYASQLRVGVYLLFSICVAIVLAQALRFARSADGARNVLLLPLLVLSLGIGLLIVTSVPQTSTMNPAVWYSAIAVCVAANGWIFAQVNRSR